MSDRAKDELLPGASEIAFSDIEATLAKLARGGHDRRRLPGRSLTATVVVVGTTTKLKEAADALEHLGGSSGVRAILISEGSLTSPAVRVSEHSVAITDLAPRYVDNAVAALRLSSLPAVVWWRGGSTEALGELAELADRLVLDTDDPSDVWAAADTLFAQTAVTDLRWTRLTRWRSLLANCFDIPQVCDAIPKLNRLTIEAHDAPSARLFAGWLVSTLRPAAPWQLSIASGKGESQLPLDSVQLASDDVTVTIQARGDSIEARIDKPHSCARVAPLNDRTLARLFGEELAVRARDVAFEAALRASRSL